WIFVDSGVAGTQLRPVARRLPAASRLSLNAFARSGSCLTKSGSVSTDVREGTPPLASISLALAFDVIHDTKAQPASFFLLLLGRPKLQPPTGPKRPSIPFGGGT